jgi:hypothetical protein
MMNDECGMMNGKSPGIARSLFQRFTIPASGAAFYIHHSSFRIHHSR